MGVASNGAHHGDARRVLLTKLAVSDSPLANGGFAMSRKLKKVDNSRKPAIAGIALMGVMSMGLNGYANAAHSPEPWAGWAMGIAIPCIVLLVARVAACKWQAGKLIDAKIGAGIIAALLALSVWHCAVSIAALTGSHILLAVPMAIAIDCGLVYCEWALLD